MSAISSIRAASGADPRSAVANPDKHRVTSLSNQDDLKQGRDPTFITVQRQKNPQEKKAQAESYFAQTRTGSGRHRDAPRPDYKRGHSKKGGSDAARVLWSPQASIVSATSAPLASRISVPPLSSYAPSDLQPQSLAEMSLEAQESAILEDLLFVFMGFEGHYIRFNDSYDPREEQERLAGPEFRILGGLDPSLRDLTSSLLKMASHHIALEAFVEVESREEFGTVNHALCAAIRKMLKDFITLVAQLEHQLLTNDDFTLHVLSLHTKPTSYMLLQLYSLAHEILKRNSMLEENLDDSDDMDDVDNIIESLREGGDAGNVTGKKICKGGDVIGLITKRLASMAGDPAARTLLTSLLRETTKPYMTMLNVWLHHGGIKDPHNEFLIKEQKSIRRERLEQDYTDEYWEKRYTVREGDVPPQLEAVKEKVLLAGKYLNVVRECGGVDLSTGVKDAPISFDDPRFLDNVNNAYQNANSSLLNLLITTHALPARLRSMKHYFFLDRSDFFAYFLELSHTELRKTAKTVNSDKLQSLLDFVISQPGTVAMSDPFKDDIKIKINEVGLTNWLMRIVTVTGLDTESANPSMGSLLATPALNVPENDKDIKGYEALVFDYTVPFPLSLVISRIRITNYQLLFRYLLSLRYLENQLTTAWSDGNKSNTFQKRSGSNKKLESLKRKAWTLRARMLCFVQQMLYYCTAEVIEPHWQKFMASLHEGGLKDATATSSAPSNMKMTVDELMAEHAEFLTTCMKECMLTNAKLLKINSSLLKACAQFASFTGNITRIFAAAEKDTSDPNADDTKTKKAADNLETYDRYFSRNLLKLVDTLNLLAATETSAFLDLCARLSAAVEGLPGGGLPSQSIT